MFKTVKATVWVYLKLSLSNIVNFTRSFLLICWCQTVLFSGTSWLHLSISLLKFKLHQWTTTNLHSPNASQLKLLTLSIRSGCFPSRSCTRAKNPSEQFTLLTKRNHCVQNRTQHSGGLCSNPLCPLHSHFTTVSEPNAACGSGCLWPSFQPFGSDQ